MKNKLFNTGVILLLFLFVHLELIAQNDTKIIATINGEPIAVGEFDLFASQNRSKVIQHFRNNYNTDYSEKFWGKRIKGDSPLELLKKMTFEDLIELKIQQLLAREYGIVEHIDYINFLKKLSAENIRRANKIAKAEAIYGPKVYSKEVYFDYLISNMVIQLKDSLVIKKRIAITGDEVVKEGVLENTGENNHTQVSKFNNELNYKYNQLIRSLISTSKLKINKTVLKNYLFEKNYY